MTSKKSTTVKPTRARITTESKLVLPQDIGGFTVNFRREAARSVGRIMADQKKLDVYLELLERFAEYAKDRFEGQVEDRAKAIADKAKTLKAAEERALRDANGVIAGKRAHIEHLAAEVAAYDKKMEKYDG